MANSDAELRKSTRQQKSDSTTDDFSLCFEAEKKQGSFCRVMNVEPHTPEKTQDLAGKRALQQYG